jgi:Holliday junction resolvase RusA-like endonuclease
MSQQLSVFIPCLVPTVTSQQKGAFAAKGGGVRFFKKKAVKQSENTFAALLMPHVPKEPFTGPLCFIITLTFPWRKSEKKSRIKSFSSYPIETRPDCSNLIKTIEDVMTSLRFWNDDGQISSLHIAKCYGDKPGIRINLTSDLAISKDGETTSL